MVLKSGGMSGSSRIFTLRLSHLPASRNSIRVPVTLSLEDTAGPSAMASVSPSRLILTADRSSHRVTLHAEERNELERGLLLRMQADADASPAYAGAARNIPLSVVNLIPEKENEAFCRAVDILETGFCPRFFSSAESSAAPWTIVDDLLAENGRALKSGGIGNRQNSCIGFVFQDPLAITYLWRTSSEPGYDYLRYYLDRVQLATSLLQTNTADRRSGIDSAYASYTRLIPIRENKNTRTVEWCYQKDGTRKEGDDAAYLDGIIPFAPVQIAELPAVVAEGDAEQLRLFVDGALLSTLRFTLAARPVFDPSLPERTRQSIRNSLPLITITPASVTIGIGQSPSARTRIAVRADNKPNRSQRMQLTLAGSDDRYKNGISLVGDTFLTLAASDTPTIAFAQSSVDIVEGAVRTMVILADPPPMNDVAVRLSADGSSAGVIGFPENLVVPQGQPLVRFDLSAAENSSGSKATNIRLSLAETNAFAAIGSSKVLTVNVIDNDQANSIGFANNVLSLKEGTTQAIIIASNELVSITTVTVAVENHGQITLTDSRADSSVPGTQLSIVLPVGSTRYAVVVGSPKDGKPEREQNYIIQLSLAEHKRADTSATLTVPFITVTIQSSIRLRIKVYLEGAL